MTSRELVEDIEVCGEQGVKPLNSKDTGQSTKRGDSGNTEGLEAYRCELVANVPALLSKATAEYRRFNEVSPSDDPKAFTAHQTGCRAALAHIQLLIRLADWAVSRDRTTDIQEEDNDIEDLLNEAEAALKKQYSSN
jgi:hypothetical protein